MSIRRAFLLGLLLFAALTLVSVPAHAPQHATGKAPIEILVEGLHVPTGIAVDPDGTAYFTDRKAGRLWQRAPTGNLLLLEDRLTRPRGLLRTADGSLYLVADRWSGPTGDSQARGVLLKWHPRDHFLTVVATNIRKPQQLALDLSNHILLSTAGSRPQRLDGEDETADLEDVEVEDADAVDAEENDAREGLPPAFRGTVLRIHPETGEILSSYTGFRRPVGVVSDEVDALAVAAKAFRQGDTLQSGSLFQIAQGGQVHLLLPKAFSRPKGLVRDPLGFFFLAVKRDRDHPTVGGLILKVTPDGSFTCFAQGFALPWGLTFDDQGNLYVSDPAAGTITRFFAPAAPVLAGLPERTTQSRIALVGTADPEAQITVRGGQEQVSTLADLEGKFSVDVPLVPGQVNGLKVYAIGAQGDGLTSAPATAAIQQQTTPPPVSVTIALQITEPAPGATITADSILVRGLVDAGGLEVGVTVNDIVGAVQGTAFASLVPVGSETTTLTAVVTTAAGATASQSIGITIGTSPTPEIALRLRPPSGVAPLRVSFSLVGAAAPSAIVLDHEGDGVIDFTGTSLDGQSFTYEHPGLYTPSVTVSDADGNRSTARTVVQVYDGTDLDSILQGKWTGMRGTLREGRIEPVLEFIARDFREEFRADFTALAPFLATIGQALEDVRFVGIRGDRAQYELLSTENGLTFSYLVEFVRDIDGIWRIAFF